MQATSACILTSSNRGRAPSLLHPRTHHQAHSPSKAAPSLSPLHPRTHHQPHSSSPSLNIYSSTITLTSPPPHSPSTSLTITLTQHLQQLHHLHLHAAAASQRHPRTHHQQQLHQLTNHNAARCTLLLLPSAIVALTINSNPINLFQRY